tara:strand:+ start:3069 stop:4307 length:1239 start_codon:yes stop_codon:yes gene_type:complete
MQQSHLNKIAEAYNKIAEGKEPCPVHEKAEASKVDKKKMHKCTCESFYYKRLQAMNPEMAEMYLEIAEELVDRGYESARLLDNIIESLPKDFTGHEFRSSLAAVNPRLNEAIHTAEKKQARVIAASFVESLKQARKNVGASTCWDGYKAKGTKKKNGRDVPNCVKEGIRDLDPEKGTKERKARLEKKRGMKLDDHPQFKKEVEEAYTVTNADKKGNTKAYQNFKKGMKGKDGQPLYKAADHMKEATYPSDFKNGVARKKKGMPNAQGPESGKKEIDEGLKQARKEEITEKKKGLWDNIHAKRKRGEKPAKPGDKDYPKTLNVEAKKNDSYLETDFKKRQANNEKARKDMEKMGTKMKNPHFEDLQYYDVVLQHLDEKYVIESVEEAEEIMMQLTGAQIVEIIDEFMNSKEES